MYIRRTSKTVKGKTYHNYLLVASVATPNGPRQRTGPRGEGQVGRTGTGVPPASGPRHGSQRRSVLSW